jgi:hypothetical protein
MNSSKLISKLYNTLNILICVCVCVCVYVCMYVLVHLGTDREIENKHILIPGGELFSST